MFSLETGTSTSIKTKNKQKIEPKQNIFQTKNFPLSFQSYHNYDVFVLYFWKQGFKRLSILCKPEMFSSLCFMCIPVMLCPIISSLFKNHLRCVVITRLTKWSCHKFAEFVIFRIRLRLHFQYWWGVAQN